MSKFVCLMQHKLIPYMKKWPLISLALLLVACGEKTYKQTSDGVVVTVQEPSEGGPSKIRLKVINDRIIRVTETPDKKFVDRKSLIILPQSSSKTQFTVEQEGCGVFLKTQEITARICSKHGKVSFFDADGNPLTAETEPSKFTPVTADATTGYSVINRFDTTEDEGIYGLGQHQSDQWNYRGENEELYQYNTKISMPFVISSKNYGILWDTYSQGRFGNPEPYQQLQRVFKLYDKDGNPGHLTGSYVSSFRGWGMRPGQSAQQQVMVREEDSLFYGNSEAVKNLPRLGSDVYYEGYLEPEESGVFNFLLYYAGYVKVIIDGQDVVGERWRTSWNPNGYKFKQELEAGKKYSLRVEWKPDGGSSYIALRAYSPVDQEIQDKLTMWTEMVPESDYYVMVGDNMDGVISGLRTLVGKANIMPKWAMGYWQSREAYKTQDEIVDNMRTMREKGIGVDNIVQDWNYWVQDSWGAHDFDPARYPDPQAMMDSVHAMHGHLMISVWPKFYASTEHFKEFDEKGWMFRQAVEDSIRDWVGPGYIGSFYDAYSSGARKLFWSQMKEHLYKYGIDAWWMDASEPNVRDCVPLDYQQKLTGPTELGPSKEYFMGYALMNAKAIYEGLRETDNNTRVFQLTRNGYLGMQRYSAASWSGDIGTRWEDLYSQIVAGMNYSLCGNPYWTMDIGGFCVENRYSNAQNLYDRTGEVNEDLVEWRELQTRWFQFGTFTPIYRAHGQFPRREFWNIAPEDDPTYQSILYYNQMRYRMMPYIYSLAGMAYMQDYTMMRGLVMDYSDDAKTLNVKDQFMLGPSLMICPIYQYKMRERQVYLPEGAIWYEYENPSKSFAGGQTITADAPYERMPMYVPSGAILVYGPQIQYVDEVPATELSVSVYAGKDGSFTLYEDDGVTYSYENGSYSEIPMTYSDAAGKLTIGERKGSYEGMIQNRTINVTLYGKGEPKTVTVAYSGSAVEVAL